MRGLIFTCYLFLLTALATAGQQPEAISLPTVELPAELARVLTDYESNYGTGGSDLAAIFTEDGFVLSGGRPPIRGRDAIAEYYRGGGSLALRAIAYEVSGSVGYIIGGYTRNAGDPYLGKFTLTLRKESDGRWYIFSDMDNSNRPMGRNSIPGGNPKRYPDES